MLTSSVIPLIVVLVLGCFALFILKGFVSRIPSPAALEKKPQEDPQQRLLEEEEMRDSSPRLEFNKKELQSQKEQNITELNEAIMAAPEDAAKLLTSYIRE